MNLNKNTKAELISKFRKLDSINETNKNSIINKLKSYLSLGLNFLIRFKTILLKITLISFLIKLFKKYSLLRRIWSILNTVIVTIFGISLLDNLGLDSISNFFKEIKF